MEHAPLRNRIAVAAFFFVSGFGFSTWASRIPNIQQQLQLNDAQLGVVLFAFPAGLLLMLPFTGMLLRRFSSRYTMLFGAVFFNIMLCLTGFTNQVWQLAMVLFFFGASRNLFNISVNAQSIGVQKRYIKPVIASFHGIWSVASFAGASFGSFMVSMNWLPAWHFLVVGLTLTTIAFFFYNHTVPDQPQPHERKGGFKLPDTALLKLGCICFAAMAVEGTMYDWSVIYMKKAVRATEFMASAGYTVYTLTMTIGRFTGDRIANALGVRNMLRYSGGLICLGLLLAAVFPFTITTAAGFMMTGFGVSCIVPMVFSVAGRIKGISGGPAIAGVSTVGYFGFLIVPPFIGFIAETFHFRWAFGLIALLGGLIIWLVNQWKE